MRDYDGELIQVKRRVEKLVIAHASKPLPVEELSQMICDLNSAWDALTDALVRQRNERDKVIAHLMNQLAERKP